MPWGERRCNPGCGCSKPLRRLARAFEPVVVPVQGYSARMAASVPNASLDLAFIDAAHDYRNARNDVIAYWSKLKPTGIMAGHDFGRTPSAAFTCCAPLKPCTSPASSLAREVCPAVAHTHHLLCGTRLTDWRNWGETRQDLQNARGPYAVVPKKKAIPPAYGVVQATQELFFSCHVHVRWNTWWVERQKCELQRLLTDEEVAA